MLCFLLCVTLAISFGDALHESPLCLYCNCETKVITYWDQYDVITCPSKLRRNIFNEANWRNSTTIYRIWSFTVEHNFVGNLSEIFPTSNLIELSLYKNEITGIFVDVFRNLNILEVLILSNNELEVFLENESQEPVSLPLQYLNELRLDHNKLCSLNSDIFKKVISLKILDLSYNPIKSIDDQTLKALEGLTHLKELYLRNTQITSLPDGLLHSLNMLEILDLSENPITLIPQSLGDCRSLTHLYMNNTEIVRLSGHNIFPVIPTVESLHLSHNNYLVQIGMFSFGGLMGLKNLSLSNNLALSKIESYAFANMTDDRRGYSWLRIERLYIQYNNLSYLDPNVTGEWTHLIDMDIGGNSWACDCKNQWLIDDLYPRYLDISKQNAISTVCSSPRNMANVKFQDLFNNKTRLKCVEDRRTVDNDINSSIVVPAVSGFFAGFLIAIPLVIIIVLGYQRSWFSRCGRKRFRSSTNMQLYEQDNVFDI